MADEDAAAQAEGSPWADDASPDAASFEPPAGWSDAIEWPLVDGEIDAPAAEVAVAAVEVAVADVEDVGPAIEPVAAFAEVGAVVPTGAPARDVEPDLFFGHTVAAPVVGGNADFQLEPLSDSIWSAEAALGEAHAAVPVSDASAPAFYAEAERHRSGRPDRRFHLRHTNAAFIGLVAFVSLVLLGLFFSVRTRSDIASTEAAQHPPTAANIGAQGLPVLTLPTTTVPGVSFADQLAPGSTAAADPGTTVAPDAPGGPTTPSATTPTTRAAAPSGGGTSTPTTATTATTATTVSQPTTTQPPVTSPPDTTQATVATTTPRPTVPDPTVPAFTVPSVPFPTAPTTPTVPRRGTPFTGLG